MGDQAKRVRITKQLVDNLPPNSEVRDSDLRGFGVRRQLGTPRYFVQTRIKGRMKRLTIGTHGGPWTAETARREAARLLMAVRAGSDPARARDAARVDAMVFTEVAAEYMTVHGAKLKPRTREEYGRLVRRQLTDAFGRMAVAEISERDVARMHARLKDTPRAANHALAVLSSIMEWAQTQGYRAKGSNPCTTIERFAEVERERYLTEEELARLLSSLDRHASNGVNVFVIGAIRLLLLTGARLSEILTLKWAYVDYERRMIRLPDSKTGAKPIILSEAAWSVLASLPRLAENPWVFPGHIHGQHLVNLQKPWRSIRADAGLDDVRLHDLRHSFASFAVDAGGTLPVIGNLLGHSQAQTTARYAHVAPSIARQVADAVGHRIMAASPAGAARESSPLDQTGEPRQTERQGTAGKPGPGR